MGAAAYNRGSRVVVAGIDRDVSPGMHARADREAYRDERARLLSRIAELETALRRSERSRAFLRASLTEERRARAEENERHEGAHRITCAALARYARLAGIEGWE